MPAALLNPRFGRPRECVKAIYHRMGWLTPVEDTNKWLGLAANIWNNTPQPHRGAKSANQMVREWRREKEKPYSSDGW
jgi:hypothetical protein